MLKNLLLVGMAVSISAGVLASAAGRSNETNAKLVIPAPKTAPTSGKQMYASYCATCHGMNGRGDGPMASALKTPPSDLTLLSKLNGGKYPSAHVVVVLQEGSKIQAHGSTEMPAWGPVLAKMDQNNPQETELRISNLSHYLETIQAR